MRAMFNTPPSESELWNQEAMFLASCSWRVANRTLSLGALCLTVLCKVCERKTAIFRPSKVPLLSILV
jgi:hypothetical protein